MTGPRTGKRGRTKVKDGKIDMKKLDFAFNASFASLNVAKVMMKEMGMEYSMSAFKSLMTSTYLVKRIFNELLLHQVKYKSFYTIKNII